MTSFSEPLNLNISRIQSTATEAPDVTEDNEKGDDDNSQSPAVSWMLRVRSKNDELKKFFGLPINENLLEEYHCALRWHILLQGRMYVFEKHVCFYSNVFGYARKKVIQLKDVIAVKKKTHCRFPNSIELESLDHRDFFTSFLSRDDAFRLVVNAWHQCSDAGRTASDGSMDQEEEEEGGGHEGVSDSFRRRALSVDVGGLMESPGPDSVVPSSMSHSGRRVMFDTPTSTRRRSKGAGAGPLHHAVSDISGMSLSGAEGTLLEDRASEGDEIDYDSSGPDEDDPFQHAVSTPAPRPQSEAKVLVSAELDCSPKEFYQRFLSNKSHFLEDVHEAAGDRRVILSSWRREPELGLVRDLSFVSPIKGFANWGASQAQCYQTQRLTCHAGSTLLLETSQVINDIPYGDCFKVEMRWTVSPLPSAPQRSSMQIHLFVDFTRKCLFKSLIQGGTQKQSLEFYTDLIRLARQALQSGGSSEPAPKPQAGQKPTVVAVAEAGMDAKGDDGDTLALTHSELSFSKQPVLLRTNSLLASTGPASTSTIVVVVVALVLQVVFIFLWLSRSSTPRVSSRTVEMWLQQLDTLQRETNMLQQRMKLVQSEAQLVMGQLQQSLKEQGL